MRYYRDDDMMMDDEHERRRMMRRYPRMYRDDRYNRDGYVFAGMVEDIDDYMEEDDDYMDDKRFYRQGVRGTGPYGVGGRMYPGRRYRRDYRRGYNDGNYRRDDYPFDSASLMGGIDEMIEEEEPHKKEILTEWQNNMKNVDGTTGAHFKKEQIEKIYRDERVQEKGVSMEDFEAAMNMIYSDYSKALKENGLNSQKIYADLAVAFLKDDDAADNKLMRYALLISKQNKKDST